MPQRYWIDYTSLYDRQRREQRTEPIKDNRSLIFSGKILFKFFEFKRREDGFPVDRCHPSAISLLAALLFLLSDHHYLLLQFILIFRGYSFHYYLFHPSLLLFFFSVFLFLLLFFFSVFLFSLWTFFFPEETEKAGRSCHGFFLLISVAESRVIVKYINTW